MSLRKVLIPLDGSTLSPASIPYLTRLLRPAEATLILLRVADGALGPGRRVSTAALDSLASTDV